MLWEDLVRAIRNNAERNTFVKVLRVWRSTANVDNFPLMPVLTPSIVQTSPMKTIQYLPPPPPVVVVKAPTVNVPVSVPKVIATSATTATTTSVRKQTPAGNISEPRTMKYEVDPVVLGIEQFECLYDTAPNVARKQMECAEAQRIEGLLDELYKSQGGRSRGWTKGGLETLIKPRCASGGDVRELDRAKRAFPWHIVDHDKLASAFLDFLCVAKKIRVAVWYTDEKQVIVYPAADRLESVGTVIPLYHVSCTGHPRTGFRNIKEFLKFCVDQHYALLPPTTVMSSLSGLTLSELDSVGTKLGMTSVEGSKAERVARIAAYKLHMRLTKS